MRRIKLTETQLTKIISKVLKEKFESKAQARFFHAKANEPGKEGEKWKKWTKEFSDDTKDISKLPEKKKKNKKELNEFMGPEEYIVQLSLPAIDDMHASQLIKDCMVNGCPDKLDNISLISSTLR